MIEQTTYELPVLTRPASVQWVTNNDAWHERECNLVPLAIHLVPLVVTQEELDALKVSGEAVQAKMLAAIVR